MDARTRAEHYLTCAVCGQPFDLRDLGAVIHHEQAEHEPVDPAVLPLIGSLGVRQPTGEVMP